MRLVIREYLSMLKESGELDVLVPDLLLSMDIIPTSKAQVGVRQHGVDVAGIGPDPSDSGKRKLFLVTIKRGDLDRRSWDASGELQGVRRSLNEIRDAYLPLRVSRAHRDLPAKIILCCGGDMKQGVADNWKGYVADNAEEEKREYEFWGGDQLALFVEQYMLGEHLFPEAPRKQIRKTIALVDENEQPPQHFYDLGHELLFERDLPIGNRKPDARKRQRALRLLNLSLNIVFHWGREAGNLRSALLGAERTVLTAWDWMRANDLFDCKKTYGGFIRLFQTYFAVTKAFAQKLEPHCIVEDGFAGRGSDAIEYSIRTFEAIGFLGLACLSHLKLAQVAAVVEASGTSEIGESKRAAGSKDNRGPAGKRADGASADEAQEPLSRRLEREAADAATTLAYLIANNASSLTPCYDEHIIDLTVGLVALRETGHIGDARAWVEQLGRRISFAFDAMGRHFPIATDSHEDLVALHAGNDAPQKEELMKLSTLLPALGHWHVALGLSGSYAVFAENIQEVFAETNFQLWYPGEDTDEYLYRTNAGRESGMTVSSLSMPDTFEELREQVVQLRETRQEHESLSCFEKGWPVLSLIASRHFRTPVLPVWWQS